MSTDGRVLIVDRFDIDAEGNPVCGVEDMCSLLGLPPQEKYRSTQEEVLKAARAYLPQADSLTQLERFGWHMLTSYVVRNADCHTKNIALYYRSVTDVAFAPAYDIVTTQAYPRYADNPPGLSVGGRKTWSPGKAMEQFFNGRLGIPPRQYAQMVERLCESAVTTGREVIEAARNETRWHDVARQMVHAWNDGMESLRSPRKSIHLRGLTEFIEAAKFSPPEPPEKPPVIGRSELLAGKQHRKK
jgi:serine/threonine-protein kinase HipA